MGFALFAACLVMAVLVVAAAVSTRNARAVTGSLVLAVLLLLVGLLLGSVVYVGPDQVGIVTKQAMGASLKEGKIIAVDGEMGVQADVLAPGWHVGYVPGVFTVTREPLTEVPSDKVGLIEAADGLPNEEGQLFAPEWGNAEVPRMLDARHFLTAGGGRKGKQVTVLKPGKYRLNTQLFRVKMVDQTAVNQGEVAVLKANFGKPASTVVRGVAGASEPGKHGDEVTEDRLIRLAGEAEMGIRAAVLPPGKYPLNTEAYTVTEVWTTQMIAQFTAAGTGTMTSGGESSTGRGSVGVMGHDPSLEERAITVRTADGFTFPVDVRIEYAVEAVNAPVMVAKLGDDEGPRFRNALNSAVRAIFRNNAETVRALDYVQQRSTQESQSLRMLTAQMARFGVTVTAVRIGNVGDEQSLGSLLKTQTDRELAKQEQVTFQEQQRAAEQKKLLTRTTQEAEEEKRLATAAYEVKIAEESKQRKVIEARGEAESVQIRAEAQAAAYERIARQIGAGNAALIEVLKIVGERNILITPRVMVGAGTASAGNGATTALIGTMLDSMITRDDLPGGGVPVGGGAAGGAKAAEKK